MYICIENVCPPTNQSHTSAKYTRRARDAHASNAEQIICFKTFSVCNTLLNDTIYKIRTNAIATDMEYAAQSKPAGCEAH